MYDTSLHVDLHSFPTRRSSDLSQNEAAQKHLLNMQEEMDKTGAWEANTEAKTILTKLGVTDFDKPVSELSGGQQKRVRSEEHTSELQSRGHLVCRLLLEKKKTE